ncbi:hypothetical protein L226DRAFT_575557 [Lentinus tigrinus ALCF2SS1-7]|uniref:DUF6699 domain-containing protein n=1 Tax=Lentinus tigrinus ALCF2SS1-6 TaxID=1328759 RepID=A0A5C2S8W5_9APHY|nr:hypothetical protein L227DRAFT_611264 [Lentinus tigrinus ALCF2SS1-6]RPD69568.1 hypothetical protein L226DRAFT_575557 [Lentinus tigrinus ALCF2SS1-7]
MANVLTAKSVRFMDTPRVYFLAPQGSDDDNVSSSSGSASLQSTPGARALSNTGFATSAGPHNNRVYTTANGLPGLTTSAPGNMYGEPGVAQQPQGNMPRVHALLKDLPFPYNVRAGPADVREAVFGEAAFDVSPSVVTLRFESVFDSGYKLRWYYTIHARRGYWISVGDVLNGIYAGVCQPGLLPPDRDVYPHAQAAMAARGGHHMRTMDWFAPATGPMYFRGMRPEIGPEGWEYVLRFSARPPPST